MPSLPLSAQDMSDRFVKLYRRQAHVHHYTQFMAGGAAMFGEAHESLRALIGDYRALQIR